MASPSAYPVRAAWQATVCTGVQALARSLRLRVARHEGAIALVAVALLLRREVAPAPAAVASLAIVALVAAFYTENDWCDRVEDLRDPAKDHAHARWLAQHSAAVQGTVWSTQGAATLALAASVGPAGALAAALATVTNALYCRWGKRRAGADLVAAPLWGGALAAASGETDVDLLLLVAAMTTVCHLFQLRRDRDVDAGNRLVTSAVAGRGWCRPALAACCLLLAASLWRLGAPGAAVTAWVPLALGWPESARTPAGAVRAWRLARLWFAIVFVAAWGSTDGR